VYSKEWPMSKVSAYQGTEKFVSGEAMPPLPFGLRAATEPDCEFLWCLTATTMRGYIAEVAVWEEHLQEQQFWCTFDPARWRVLTVDGKDGGGFAAHSHPQALYLSDLYLLPEYQGRGIGSAVIRKLSAEAWAMGTPLVLQVLDSNPKARHLYERLGFSFVGPSPMPHYALMAAYP
jgi:ribosomal protein S18 acetylase RimI-like enzyme